MPNIFEIIVGVFGGIGFVTTISHIVDYLVDKFNK
jgi:hypothetical protein